MPNIQENFTEEQLNLISSGTDTVAFDIDTGDDYIRLSLFTPNGNFTGRQFFSNQNISGQGTPQIQIYENATTSDIFVKPNDILDLNAVPSGNYLLQFDFLRDLFDDNSFDTSGLTAPTFFINEISPSRKEIRLFVVDGTTSVPINDAFITALDTSIGTFNYEWIVGVSKARNLTIVNYTIDKVTDEDNYSLIIRLNKPLPNDIKKLSECSIQKEVLVTQTQDIIYVSSVGTVNIGGPLVPDTSFEYEQNIGTQDTFENKNEMLLSSSLTPEIIQNISQSINKNYENLNVDFNDFENHVFFSSAVEKLKNFKSKVIDIQDFTNQISSSLAITSSHSGSTVTLLRENLFKNITGIQNSFTPYERFLYFDGQNETTSSAPGIGINFAKPYAMNKYIGSSSTDQISSKKLPNYDGFNVVYNFDTVEVTDSNIQIFDNIYLAEQSPIFNYSSSVYLSFLMRTDGEPQIVNTNLNYGSEDVLSDGIVYNRVKVPHGTFSSQVIQQPEHAEPYDGTGSYHRYIFESSQSYWRPTWQGVSGSDTGTEPSFDNRYADLNSIVDFTADGSGSSTLAAAVGSYQVLSGSSLHSDYLATASDAVPGVPIAIQDTVGKYGELLKPSVYDGDMNLDTSTLRTGSFVLPAGDLFAVRFTGSEGYDGITNTASFITDIKVTKNNPLNTLPFSPIYHTGSTEWKAWYSGSIDSASAFDEKNIHSFKNNIPDYMGQSSDYNDLKVFLSMIGEHFDIIKNYINNYTTFYEPGYKNYNETGSNITISPDNLVTMVGENFGWEFINPYTGSLGDYFSLISDGGDTLENVKTQTWRKVLNNLMYIYKTKGTLNSINAVLNSYGYPQEALRITELGGSTDHMNPQVITNEVKALKSGLSRQTGSVHYVKKKRTLYSLNMSGDDKKLHLDWYTNNTSGESIEFIFKSFNSASKTQVLLENSSSGTTTGSSTLWDIRLVPSASSTTTGSLQFRLNNSLTGSLDIATNGISMSTDYLPLTDGNLWNVMLQRMTSSAASNVSQSYHLYAGVQSGDSIQLLTAASMSIDGNSTDGINSASNENFVGTGSLTIAVGSASSNVSGNLVVGRSLTGSMAEFRVWDNTLSASKFKQHILNKYSVVGNHTTSSIDNLIYRFRLNENYVSASLTDDIIDANPYGPSTSPKAYTRDIGFVSASYSIDFISTYALSLRVGGYDQMNDRKVIVNSKREFVSPLNPLKSSVRTVYQRQDTESQPQRVTSRKLQIVKSISDKLNDYIMENFADADISSLIGNPDNRYSSSYSELDSFRKKIYTGIDVDVNKFIDAQSNVFNNSIVNNISSLLPARSNLSTIGVMIEPTILERNKHKYNKVEVSTGSGAGVYESNVLNYYFENSGSISGSYNRDLFILSMTGSEYISMDTYPMRSPLYFFQKYNDSGSRDDYLFDMSGSSYYQNYEQFNNINFNGDSGSYFYITSGSYSKPYEQKDPLYYYYNNSGSSIINMTGSSYHQNYKQFDKIKFNGDSGSYFYITTGSYSKPYEQIHPLYYNNSGSSIINMTGSSYYQNYEPFDKIKFNGDSGSYFYITTGSYIQQYDMKSPIYLNAKDSGSSDDYVFSLTGSELISPFTGSVRELADLSLFTNIRRNRITGEQFGTHSPDGQWNSYIWDAWGTGSDDVWFMNGTSSYGYYDQTFVTNKLIGDIEILSASINPGGNPTLDYSNINSFLNKTVVDEGKGFKYRGYYRRAGGSWPNIDSSSADSTFIDGRPMGRTHYFVTSSDGTILYPSNHYSVVGTTKTEMFNLFYGGYKGSIKVEGGRLSFYDPSGLDPTPSASVSLVAVAGTQTDQSIVVVNRGGINVGTGSARNP